MPEDYQDNQHHHTALKWLLAIGVLVAVLLLWLVYKNSTGETVSTSPETMSKEEIIAKQKSESNELRASITTNGIITTEQQKIELDKIKQENNITNSKSTEDQKAELDKIRDEITNN